MIAKFIVNGEPKGKGRPRSRMYGGKPRTPEDTLVYENLVGWEYKIQCKDIYFKGPVKMEIKAYYSIARSNTKKEKELKVKGFLRPTKKPDIDNVVKIIADSLNQVAYDDDTQIVELVCSKHYSNKPRVEVIISECEEGIIKTSLEDLEGGNG